MSRLNWGRFEETFHAYPGCRFWFFSIPSYFSDQTKQFFFHTIMVILPFLLKTQIHNITIYMIYSSSKYLYFILTYILSCKNVNSTLPSESAKTSVLAGPNQI